MTSSKRSTPVARSATDVPVLDASGAIELIIDRDDRAAQVRAALAGDRPHAPEIIHLEALQTLRGLVRGGRVPLTRASTAVGRLADIGLKSYPHPPLRSRIWALRDRCSAYDAAYVALAERLGMALVTADRRLARAVRGLVPVVVIAR
jgi:predicted nucleic acid-binding protein